MITIRKIINKIFYECGYSISAKHGIQIRKLYPRPFAEQLNGTNLVGAEVGVFEGEHAKSLFDIGKVKKLYLIDPYKEYNQCNSYQSQRESDLAKGNALTKLKDENVKFIYKKSDDAIDDIPNNLDFVYLDGLHNYESVKKDIENYWKKIKIGGIIGGHDIIRDSEIVSDIGVMKAVIEFITENDLEVYIKQPDWWILK